MKHYNILVKGKVQGVYYRKTAKAVAEDMNIHGFVQNNTDGTVYIEAEGEDENLNQFLEWCKEGPERAKVSELEVKETPAKGFRNFDIKR